MFKLTCASIYHFLLSDVLLGLTCTGWTTNWRIGISIEKDSAMSFHKVYERQFHRLISWIKCQTSILQSNREKRYVNTVIPNYCQQQFLTCDLEIEILKHC